MDDYSKQYGALIMALAALITNILSIFHVNFVPEQVQSLVSATVILIAIIYAMYRRYKRGDISITGAITNAPTYSPVKGPSA